MQLGQPRELPAHTRAKPFTAQRKQTFAMLTAHHPPSSRHKDHGTYRNRVCNNSLPGTTKVTSDLSRGRMEVFWQPASEPGRRQKR